jgi:GTP-binding protein
MSSSAVIAIVGRPNVGKSTLFNRFVGKRKAIESDIPGTTRDRLYHPAKLDGFATLLVDTGGLELDKDGDDIESNVQVQSQVAIQGADVILFMVDIRQELTSEDFHAVDLLRKSKKPVVLVANKCDNPSLYEQVFNLYELGFGEPVPITASHSEGLDVLEGRIGDELKELGFERAAIGEEEASERIRIAFLGRPNVGKSTMVNGILGKEAVVVSNVPGTTRDAAEIDFEYENDQFTLIDTAGLRRRGKIEKGLEKYSVLRTMQSVDEADICVLMLDFEEGITSQDCHVSAYALEQNKGLILVVNKVDVVKGEVREDLENRYIHNLKQKMAYLPWAPVVFASGLKRKNVFQILELAREIYYERKREVLEDELNVWLHMTLAKHPPKGSKGKRKFAVYSVKQTGTEPPTFTFVCEWPEYMHFSYERFLQNELRAKFGFNGVPLKMKFKKPGRD